MNRGEELGLYSLGQLHGTGDFFEAFDNPLYSPEKETDYYKRAWKNGDLPHEMLFKLATRLAPQETIAFLHDAIKKFPDSLDADLLLSKHFDRSCMKTRELVTLRDTEGRGLANTALFYQLGIIYSLATDHFKRAAVIAGTFTRSKAGGCRCK